MAESQYTPVRSTEDIARDSSAHSFLLPNPIHYALYNVPSTYTFTFGPAIIIRTLSTILALVSFIILVIDGNEEFIAADIFLMSIIITNVVLIIHHFVSNVFVVTVELRRHPWNAELGARKNKLKLASRADGGLALAALFCLIIGYSIRGWGHSWKAGAIIGYIVTLLQLLLTVPTIDRKQLTITAKLTDTMGKAPEDTKASSVVDDSERGAARRRATDSETPSETADAGHLV